MPFITPLVAILLLATSVASADERAIKMKAGPETVLLAANCSGCHSLDYIQMNSPFLKRAGWEAEVRKMIAVMGAPISEADTATLVGYLVREYGVPD
jgi:mono/diheme cytochrome c family protein